MHPVTARARGVMKPLKPMKPEKMTSCENIARRGAKGRRDGEFLCFREKSTECKNRGFIGFIGFIIKIKK